VKGGTGFQPVDGVEAAAHELEARATAHGLEAHATVLDPLRRSVDSFDRLAEIAGRLYPGIKMGTFRNCISRPIPWTHLQIWNLGQHREVTFADCAAMYRRELEWVEKELGAQYPQPLLPFEDDLSPEPKDAKLVLKWDFEGDVPAGLKVNHFPPDAAAELGSGQAPAPLVGRRLVATQKAESFWFPITTDPAKLLLEIGKTYRVTLDYWIVKDAERLGDWLSAGARTTEGGWPKDIGARYMGGPAGTRGRITLSFRPHTWRDFYVYVSLYGAASVELDNLEVWEGG
jgi:hypothetical protein